MKCFLNLLFQCIPKSSQAHFDDWMMYLKMSEKTLLAHSKAICIVPPCYKAKYNFKHNNPSLINNMLKLGAYRGCVIMCFQKTCKMQTNFFLITITLIFAILIIVQNFGKEVDFVVHNKITRVTFQG